MEICRGRLITTLATYEGLRGRFGNTWIEQQQKKHWLFIYTYLYHFPCALNHADCCLLYCRDVVSLMTRRVDQANQSISTVNFLYSYLQWYIGGFRRGPFCGKKNSLFIKGITEA